MKGKLKYRHNLMNVNSIDTFLNIKGGCCHGCRDVYFIRALGSGRDIAQYILSVDKRMGSRMQSGELFYVRMGELPALTRQEDVLFYQEHAKGLRTEQELYVKNQEKSAEFGSALGKACFEAVEKYRLIRKNMTDSIEQNFVVKLLYWTDCVLGRALSDWNERKCFKILADNVCREQEYLFYYMLTLIGCDVLFLQRRKDIETVAAVRNLSGEFVLGEFNEIPIPEYKPYKKEEALHKPERRAPERMKTAGSPAVQGMAAQSRPVQRIVEESPAVQNRTVQRVIEKRTVPQSPSSVEKSFEELALLASSIVMIEVHDQRGKAVSTGSGIMIGKDGYILTNYHVAGKGYFFSVRIEDDDRIYRTDELIKYNAVLDLAVIRINRSLSPLPVYNGKKKLVRGQKVVAIGSPLGLFNSVSDGIISGFREIETVDMIQFTAPISHGSSGGAVMNIQGEVIGISTAGIDKGQNLNLAVDYKSINMFIRGFTG